MNWQHRNDFNKALSADEKALDILLSRYTIKQSNAIVDQILRDSAIVSVTTEDGYLITRPAAMEYKAKHYAVDGQIVMHKDGLVMFS